MPCLTPWDPGFAVGHPLIDDQHRALLAQCETLAGLCGHNADPAAFDAAFSRLKALTREHFAAEVAVLVERGDTDTEDMALECDEFEYLADEIATTANFDRLELQRFAALWCLGHVRGSAQRCRAAAAAPRTGAGAGHGNGI